MQSSIPFSSSHVIPPMQHPTCHSSQSHTPQTTPQIPGAFRCSRSRCKTFPFIAEGTTFYTFFSTNEQRQILHHISCSSSNLIYRIQCSTCKVQYVGETKRHLSDKFGERRRAIEKAITQRHIDQPTAVSDHFTLPGYFINDREPIPLELIHANRDSIHKAREVLVFYFKGQHS